MTATHSLKTALGAANRDHERNPDRPLWQPGWALTVNGKPMPADTVWKVESRFGSVEPAVVMHNNGLPNFDRPIYREAPNVNVVAWGIDAEGVVKLAIIRQPRPHADDPFDLGAEEHDPVVFGQIPMGFLDKVIGVSPEDLESGRVGAVRETAEETGGTHVIEVSQPKMPLHNPNPTFVGTWSQLWFVRVDLEKVESLRPSRNEPIFSAEYITVAEIFKRLADGVDEQGAIYRMCTANSILMIFFATYPHLLAGVATKSAVTA